MWQELWCRAGRDPESRTLAIELYRAHQAWIQETLEDGIASGEFTPCDTAAHAQLVSSLCDGYGVQLMFRHPDLTIEAARDGDLGARRTSARRRPRPSPGRPLMNRRSRRTCPGGVSSSPAPPPRRSPRPAAPT